MLMVKCLKVGEFATNCYLIWDKETKKAIIVDPGDSADYIENVISDLSLNSTAIISTHGHSDHTTSAFELCLAYTIPFFMSKADEFMLKRWRPVPTIKRYLRDKDTIAVGKSKMQVLSTPGHTPGGISLYSKKAGFAITGDLCFADATFGETNYSYSDAKQLFSSLKIIKCLPSDTIIYPTHGEAFTVKRLVIDRHFLAYYR